MDATLAAFLGISVVVIVRPGQDTALTIRNTLIGGRQAGSATAIGVGLGQAVWTLGSSFGLTAILIASETAFLAVRLIGAAYLVWLGAHSLWAAIRRTRPAAHGSALDNGELTRSRAFRQGLFSNLSNPKMAVFFSSLLPQFVASGPGSLAGMLGLGLVFVSMTVSWLVAYAAVVDRVGDQLRRPRIRRAFDAVTGAILVALGARLATEPR